MADLGLAGGELINGWDSAEFNLQFAENVTYFRNAGSRSAGHGDDDLLEFQIAFAREKRFGRANNRDVENALTPFESIVVEESNGLKAEVSALLELAGEGCADETGADDSCPTGAFVGTRAIDGALVIARAKAKPDRGEPDD